MSALSESIAEIKGNAGQWEAFNTEGHCVVVAPPGSGKTKLLTTRVAYDLANRIPRPHGAACITLTNAAADELRRRLLGLGVEDRVNFSVGTVHAFVLRQIIQPFAKLTGRSELESPKIATGAQCRMSIKAAIAAVYSPFETTKYVDTTIKKYRQQLLAPADWPGASDKLRAVYRLYLKSLHDQGLNDFLELVSIAVDMVEQYETVRQVIAAKFPHLYVDEYQDLAPGLHRLVEAVCFDYYANSELFAVGDSDQAVYAWKGTRPELMDELAGHVHVKRVELQLNYRSAGAVIEVANRLRKGKNPMVGVTDGGEVSAIQCPKGLIDQYQQVLTQVEHEISIGTPLHEIAVLCPTNAQCASVAQVLRENNVPATVKEDIYRSTAATTLIEDCAVWISQGQELSDCRLGDLLRRWRWLLGETWTMKKSIALTTVLADMSADVQSASLLVEKILDAGLRTALKSPSRSDDVEEFGKMRAALQSGDWKKLSVTDLGERCRKRDRVEITTMTSSKGLEFDAVMIIGLDEQSIPSYFALSDNAQLDEDRRKFYVSLTRARKTVRIFYSGFVMAPWGDKILAGPSRFLKEAKLI